MVLSTVIVRFEWRLSHPLSGERRSVSRSKVPPAPESHSSTSSRHECYSWREILIEARDMPALQNGLRIVPLSNPI